MCNISMFILLRRVHCKKLLHTLIFVFFFRNPTIYEQLRLQIETLLPLVLSSGVSVGMALFYEATPTLAICWLSEKLRLILQPSAVGLLDMAQS